MKKLLTITALTLTVIIGGVVWYVQSTSTNHQNTVIARSETTKQFRSNTAATTTPSTTNTAANTQNHNTITDTAIRYNADGSIDTSNWQEYCNQEYGFCVKYPQGWEVEEHYYPSQNTVPRNGDRFVVSFFDRIVVNEEYPSSVITIMIEEKYIGGVGMQGWNGTYERINIGGQTVLKTVWKRDALEKSINTNANDVVYIHTDANDPLEIRDKKMQISFIGNEKKERIFDMFLETVYFTKGN